MKPARSLHMTPTKKPRSIPKKANDIPQDETVRQSRYRDDNELDEYDEHKLQKMADDPSGSPGGEGPDA